MYSRKTGKSIWKIMRDGHSEEEKGWLDIWGQNWQHLVKKRMWKLGRGRSQVDYRFSKWVCSLKCRMQDEEPVWGKKISFWYHVKSRWGGYSDEDIQEPVHRWVRDSVRSLDHLFPCLTINYLFFKAQFKYLLLPNHKGRIPRHCRSQHTLYHFWQSIYHILLFLILFFIQEGLHHDWLSLHPQYFAQPK